MDKWDIRLVLGECDDPTSHVSNWNNVFLSKDKYKYSSYMWELIIVIVSLKSSESHAIQQSTMAMYVFPQIYVSWFFKKNLFKEIELIG